MKKKLVKWPFFPRDLSCKNELGGSPRQKGPKRAKKGQKGQKLIKNTFFEQKMPFFRHFSSFFHVFLLFFTFFNIF